MTRKDYTLAEDFNRPALELIQASTIRTRAVRWLWLDWIPLGKVTLLDGRPGLGKSSMGIDLCARLTTGRPMPDGFDPQIGPANAIIVSAEDDWEDTIAPRLISAGADMGRVFNLDDISLPDDGDRLRAVIEQVGARLIIFDPLVAFVPAKYDLYKDQSARLVLKPLGKVAAATNCAVLGLRHVNKNAGQSAQDRGTGSVAIGGAARSNLIVGADPDMPDQYVLAPIKVNVGRKRSPIGYRIDSRHINTDDGETSSVSAISWLGEVDVTLDDLMAPAGQGKAMAFLRNALAHGPVASRQLQKQAAAENLSWAGAVRRASERMRVIKAPDGFEGEWAWSLPLPLKSDESVAVEQSTVEQLPPQLYTLEQTPVGSTGSGLAAAAAAFQRYRDESTGGMWSKLDGSHQKSDS